jgi:D-lyxose ketol-isomerase
MLTREEVLHRQQQSLALYQQAGLVITPEEQARIEIADFGLGAFEETGLGVLIYVNTQRVCAKEIAMLPRQTCPEHWHPTINGRPGKEETFRCRWGEVYIYVSGEPTPVRHAQPPAGREETYTVWHEIVLHPGEQYTLAPDTRHWFQSGDQGAVRVPPPAPTSRPLRRPRDPALHAHQRLARHLHRAGPWLYFRQINPL